MNRRKRKQNKEAKLADKLKLDSKSDVPRVLARLNYDVTEANKYIQLDKQRRDR